MTSLITTGPFLSANPEYVPLLGAVGIGSDPFYDAEFGRLVFHVKGFPFYQTPWMKISDLSSFDEVVRLPNVIGMASRLDYTVFRSGFPYSRRIRLPFPPGFPSGGPKRRKSPKGPSVHVVKVSDMRRTYPSAVHKGRTWASRVLSSPTGGNKSFPKRTTDRPNPEVIKRSILASRVTTQDPFSGNLTSEKTTVGIESQDLYTRSYSSVRTPGFGKLKSRDLPVNPFSATIKEVKTDMSFSASIRISDPRFYNILVHSFTNRYAPPSAPGHLPLARNKAIRKLIDKANLGLDANLAQDVAQFGQTFSLIAQSATKIYKSVRQLRRGNIPGAVEALTAGRRSSRIPRGHPSAAKSVADNWLELQYGWKPLLQDIEGTLKSLSVLQDTPGIVQSVAVSARAESDVRTTGLTVLNQSGLPNVRYLQTRTRTDCKLKLRFRLASPIRSFLAQTGFTNPINLVWEILPFSFVVDWFLPIGTYLEGFSAFDGLEFVDGSQTLFTKARTVSAVDVEAVSSFNSNSFQIEHSRYEDEQVVVARTKLTSFPTQTFPQFKNGFASVTHAANAIALLKSIF